MNRKAISCDIIERRVAVAVAVAAQRGEVCVARRVALREGMAAGSMAAPRSRSSPSARPALPRQPRLAPRRRCTEAGPKYTAFPRVGPSLQIVTKLN